MRLLLMRLSTGTTVMILLCDTATAEFDKNDAMLLIPHSFPSTTPTPTPHYKTMGIPFYNPKPHSPAAFQGHTIPDATANPISKLTFSWLSPLLKVCNDIVSY